MTSRLRGLLVTWVLLLVLLAVEFGASFLPLATIRPTARPDPGGGDGGGRRNDVHAGRARPHDRTLFATAALLWLTILLGLGSLDAMTRTDYHVEDASSK